MKKTKKVGLIISLSLIGVGLLLMVIAVASAGSDWKTIFSDDRDRVITEISQPFDSIVIETELDSVEIVPSEDSSSVAEYYSSDRSGYDLKVSNRVLTIRPRHSKRWYEYINISGFSGHEVRLLIPTGPYKSIDVETGIGSIDIHRDIVADEISTKTGIGSISMPTSSKSKVDAGIGEVNVYENPSSPPDGELDIHTGIGSVTAPRGKHTDIDTGIGDVTIRDSEVSYNGGSGSSERDGSSEVSGQKDNKTSAPESSADISKTDGSSEVSGQKDNKTSAPESSADISKTDGSSEISGQKENKTSAPESSVNTVSQASGTASSPAVTSSKAA